MTLNLSSVKEILKRTLRAMEYYSFFVTDWSKLESHHAFENEGLKQLYDEVLSKGKAKQLLSEKETREIFVKAIICLTNTPIGTYYTLEQVLMAYRPANAKMESIPSVTSENNLALSRRFDEVVVNIAPNNELIFRGLGGISRILFDNWDNLCGYAETYHFLAFIVSHEHTYHYYSLKSLLMLLQCLDYELIHNPKYLYGKTIPLGC